MGGFFNPESLAGPGLNDLGLFYSYCGSAYYYQKELKETGVPPYEEPKSQWFLSPRDYDKDAFGKQLLKLLKGDKELDEGYTDFTM